MIRLSGLLIFVGFLLALLGYTALRANQNVMQKHVDEVKAVLEAKQ